MTTQTNRPLPTLTDVRKARERLDGIAIRTPLIRNQRLDELTGGQIFLKCENLQRTGSFKFRGGYNAVAANLDVARAKGVIASSSGNHAQGVAEACQIFGVDVTIIMPADAPQSKKDRTMRSGAKLVEFDRYRDDRDAILDDLATKSGALKIHPFEHPDVIAGQGTVGLETGEQMSELGVVPDHVIACTGGGGLLAGIYLALHENYPGAAFHTAEPFGHDDQAKSHALGKRIANEQAPPSVQDAIITPLPGEASFALLKGQVGAGLVATDQDALNAVKFAFEELKLVVEPGGACALACIMNGALNVTKKTVVVTLSGGNVDSKMMAHALGV
jgi:threonine dehydratase